MARTQPGVGYGLAPAGKGPQPWSGQQQGQGHARSYAGNGLQPGIVGPALGLGGLFQALFQLGQLLI